MLLLGCFLIAQSQDSGIIYMSVDDGQNWTRADNGLPDDALANDFVLFKNTLYVATEQHGIYRSNDRGANWQPANFGLRPQQKVDALAAGATTLFAGTYTHGVYVSLDGGQSWLPANNGLTNLTIRSLDIRGESIYAGTSDGLFLSTDNARSWQRLTESMQINRLVFMDDELIVATHKGILLSKDHGKNWQPAYNQGAIRDLIVHGKELYALDFNARTLKSNDQGKSWLQSYVVEDDYISTLLSLGSRLFASRLSGLFFSYSNGLSWEKIPATIPIFKELKRLSDGTLIAARGVDGC